MKKLITFLTKFASIKSTIEWIYKGIKIAVDAIALIRKEILEIKSDFRYDELIQTILDYLNKASDAVELILKWLGSDLAAIEAEARRAVEISAKGKKKDPSADKKEKLAEVTASLSKIVEEHK